MKRSRKPKRKGVRCRVCADVVVSRYTHDFRRCECKLIAVDGGEQYLRILGDPAHWQIVDITPSKEAE